ncbi:hypothetical protein ES319_D09G181400v1 [Gossypium barbadense]|uniref:Uncharacterized protein n=1 Tax=Gossypium barbadense TaxID=3634 RepID=A0A5J5Q5L8_GOSBA|nr:hypothetical protein ES319_D09G181400v1 [Gossypium barbadense]
MVMLKLHCRNSQVRQPYPALIYLVMGIDKSLDLTASDLIDRLSFQAQQDISNLKNMLRDGKENKFVGIHSYYRFPTQNPLILLFVEF